MPHPSTITIYCCGSIAKGQPDDQRKQCWTDTERDQVSRGMAPAETHFLNPDDPITEPGNTMGQFGRDLYQVSVATIVIVDARERRGLGVGVEMAAAASLGIPIVVVAPPNTQYRRDTVTYRGATVENYVHPHVAVLANVIVDDFEAAGRHALELATHPPERNKWILDSIREYRRAILLGDHPMQQVLAALEANEQRMLYNLVAQSHADRYACTAPVPPERQLVHDLISSVEANEPHEAIDLDLAIQWIECGSPLYRTDDPATHDQHLCVYFVPFDHVRGRILLVDHIKARRWLPPGGHIEVDEDPRAAVKREADEELKLKADFHPMFGDAPFFVTINKTRAPSNCTDVTLWFIVAADDRTVLQPDPWEMNDVRWCDLATRDEWETHCDRHMPRFLDKLEAHLSVPD